MPREDGAPTPKEVVEQQGYGAIFSNTSGEAPKLDDRPSHTIYYEKKPAAEEAADDVDAA